MIRKCKAFQWFLGKRALRSFSVWTTFLPEVSFQRCASLWIWVSTGKDGTPNAWAITTLAVLWPTPGRLSRSSWLSGTWLLYLATKIFERSEMAWDFLGDRPQGLIIFLISSTETHLIFSGVSANSKRAGVIWFTRLSVHWAESSTAMSSV